MNISAALIEARQRFGPSGNVRELPMGGRLVRQVGMQNHGILVVCGEGPTWEDAFLRAVEPSAASLADITGDPAGARPATGPVPADPSRIVYASGLELRISTRDAEMLVRALSSAFHEAGRGDEQVRLATLLGVLRDGLSAIHAIHLERS